MHAPPGELRSAEIDELRSNAGLLKFLGWVLAAICLGLPVVNFIASGRPVSLVDLVLVSAGAMTIFLLRLTKTRAAATDSLFAELQTAKSSLAASEQRFQHFASASGDWFWETDAQGRFTWLSAGFEVLTGLPAGFCIGKARSEFAQSQQDLEFEPWRSHLETMERRQPFRDFCYSRIGPGGPVWASSSGVPVYSPTGEFLGYRGTGRNVTANVLAQDAARASDARLRMSVEHLNEAFSLCDPQDRFILVNRKFRELNPGTLAMVEAGCTYEEYFRASCALRVAGESAEECASRVAWRMTMRRQSRDPFELEVNPGCVLLTSDLQLPDGCTITMEIDISERKIQERRLEESEANVRFVLDNTPAVAIQQYDWDGRVVYWNSASTDIYGFSESEALGKTMGELIWTPSEAEDWLQTLRQNSASGKAIGPVEVSLTRKDRTRRVVLYSSFAIPMHNGRYRFVCMDVDITESKRVQEELLQSRELLEQVIDAIPMSIFMKDRQSNYVLVNKFMADFFRESKATLMGRHTNRLEIPDATRLKSIKDDEWVFENRQVLNQPDTQLQGPDGNWVPFHSLKIPLLDKAGQLTGLLGINRDITEELRAQKAMRDSEARFSALFHESHVPQLVSNPFTRATEDVNDAFVALTGYRPDDLIGPQQRQVDLFWGPEDDEIVGRVHESGGTTEALDVYWRRADGAKRVVSCTAVTVWTPAGPRLAWSLIDVTDQRDAQRQLQDINKTLEESVKLRTAQLTAANDELKAAMQNLETSKDALIQSEKLAALGGLVAGVAHELNTPIGNSLLSATALARSTREFGTAVDAGLKRSTLTRFLSTNQEGTTILVRNLERAAELIRSFKQVAVDQTSSQRRTFDLKEVTGEILIAYQPMLRAAGVEVKVDIPDQLDFDSYPGPLGQVLGNLLTNSVVHAFEGRDRGTIGISAQMSAAGNVTLKVTDDGCGIPQKDLARIFDPFFTTRLGKGGSGLGLSIVHNSVSGVLGGTVSVMSEKTVGTSFTICIPLIAPFRQAAQQSLQGEQLKGANATVPGATGIVIPD